MVAWGASLLADVAGDELQLLGSATIVRLGGHFPGSCVLHWSEGCSRSGILCSGIWGLTGWQQPCMLHLPYPSRPLSNTACTWAATEYSLVPLLI